jgi:phosphate transport system permease protein
MENPLKRRWSTERLIDEIVISVSRGTSICIVLILLLIIGTIGWSSFPAVSKFGFGFLFESGWNPVEGREQYGGLTMIYGTIVSSALALALSTPLGVGTAIFLSHDSVPQQVRSLLSPMVELLAAVPSIVYGIWGLFVVIPLLRPLEIFLHNYFGWIPLFSTPPVGPGMLPATVVLAIMILPTIVVVSRDCLLAVPVEWRQGGIALGATTWETLWRISLPAAFPGIMAGLMLALGRALGETMAVTMLIGNSNSFQISLLAPANTVASLLANQFAEAKDMQISALMYAGLTLLVTILLINLIARGIIHQIKR